MVITLPVELAGAGQRMLGLDMFGNSWVWLTLQVELQTCGYCNALVGEAYGSPLAQQLLPSSQTTKKPEVFPVRAFKCSGLR